MKNINTSFIIESIQQDIQKKIDMEQKRLSDIRTALRATEQFLLDNGYEELKESDDILEEVMKTIKKMKQQTLTNQDDIKNIERSIKSLRGIKNAIDESIILSLENKIHEIEADIEEIDEKLASITDSLGILLQLQIVCPVCNGSCNIQTTATTDEKRFAKASSTTCNYCEGVGFLNIEKILLNEGVIDMKMAKHQNNFQQVSTPPVPDQIENLPNQSGHNKYIITRQ